MDMIVWMIDLTPEDEAPDVDSINTFGVRSAAHRKCRRRSISAFLMAGDGNSLRNGAHFFLEKESTHGEELCHGASGKRLPQRIQEGAENNSR